MEGFKPANDNERMGKDERYESWRELKSHGYEKAVELITAQGLEADIKSASSEEIEKLITELPNIIEKYTYDENGNIQNENRYIVRTLSLYLEVAVRKQKYEEIELPQAA